MAAVNELPELIAAVKEELMEEGPEAAASDTERSRLWTGGLASSCPGLTERLIAEWGTNAAGEEKEYTDLQPNKTAEAESLVGK